MLLFVTRCLKLYKLFRHNSLKLITPFATNIPLALHVLSYFIILLKAWLYPTCSFLTVSFLYWLHIWQQYIMQQNALKSFTFTLGEHKEKFLIRLLLRALQIPLCLNILQSSDKSSVNIIPRYLYLVTHRKRCAFKKTIYAHGELLRCPHKRIVAIMKVYIARNNMQVQFIRFGQQICNAISLTEGNSRSDRVYCHSIGLGPSIGYNWYSHLCQVRLSPLNRFVVIGPPIMLLIFADYRFVNPYY